MDSRTRTRSSDEQSASGDKSGDAVTYEVALAGREAVRHALGVLHAAPVDAREVDFVLGVRVAARGVELPSVCDVVGQLAD